LVGAEVSKDIKKAINNLAKAVRKKFAKSKTEIGVGLTSLPTVKRWVPTGCPPFDVILGGGVPCGRIIEIYGDESQGKSAIGEAILASAQQHGAVPVLIDTEYSLEEQKAERWGMDLQRILPVYPDTMEDCFETIATIIATQRELGTPTVIVWDTLAATPTRKELEAKYDDETPARQARLMSKALKKVYQDIARTKTALVVLNQTRKKIGVMFGSKKTTPAGKALRFYAAARVEIRIRKRLKKGDIVIGIETELRTVKNKLIAPLKKCVANIYFQTGLHPAESLLFSLKEVDRAKIKDNKVVIEGSSFDKDELMEEMYSDEELMLHLQEMFKNETFQ